MIAKGGAEGACAGTGGGKLASNFTGKGSSFVAAVAGVGDDRIFLGEGLGGSPKLKPETSKINLFE